MIDTELARHLGEILDAVGTIEGRCLALRDAITRELSDSYHSDEFNDGLIDGFDRVRHHVAECYKAADIEPAPWNATFEEELEEVTFDDGLAAANADIPPVEQPE